MPDAHAFHLVGSGLQFAPAITTTILIRMALTIKLTIT